MARQDHGAAEGDRPRHPRPHALACELAELASGYRHRERAARHQRMTRSMTSESTSISRCANRRGARRYSSNSGQSGRWSDRRRPGEQLPRRRRSEMSGRSHRERQIAEVLARHGLSHLVGVLGLERLRGVAGRPPPREPYSSPRELRLALEELGPTFIKLGQIVSTRGDLLGPEYRGELAKLQDAGPSVPWAEIREVGGAGAGRRHRGCVCLVRAGALGGRLDRASTRRDAP